ALRRRGKVTSVDKRNVLETSRLWREVVDDVSQEYPDVQVEHQLVDSMAMLLVLRPQAFDVVLAENMFGDILSDELGGVVGSLGVMASASLGDGTPGLYEPVHGSAPDIAGKDLANPLGAILSLAMLAEHSLDLPWIARAIEGASGRCSPRACAQRHRGGHARRDTGRHPRHGRAHRGLARPEPPHPAGPQRGPTSERRWTVMWDTGAHTLLQCLQEEGVEVIFGYPGGAVLPIYDALYD
ncbi:Isocitrate/isopropylmalate dehydrogenase, partial [mine drainage metagenome]